MNEPLNSPDELQAQIQYRLVEQLAASERRYRELLAGMQEIVLTVDSSGLITFVNEAWTRTLGHAGEDVLGSSFASFIVEEEMADPVPGEFRGFSEQPPRRQVIEVQLALRHRDGCVVSFAFSGRMNQDNELVATLFDVTGRMLEERVRAMVALEELLRRASVAVFAIDTDGLMTNRNHVFTRLMGSSEQPEQLPIDQVFGQEESARLLPAVRLVCSGENVEELEMGVPLAGGGSGRVILNLWPRRNADEAIIGAWCVGHDVSELRRHQNHLEHLVARRTEDLSVALGRAEALNTMKDQFVKNVSHEFRTPLAQIQLATGILREHGEKLSVEQGRVRMGKIVGAVERMTYLLDELIANSSKLSGAQGRASELVDLRRHCEDGVASLQAQPATDCEIECTFEGVIEPLLINVSVFDRVFRHLLESALDRAGGTGPLHVRLTRLGDDLELSVSGPDAPHMVGEFKTSAAPLGADGAPRVPNYAISTPIIRYAATQLQAQFAVRTDEAGVMHVTMHMSLLRPDQS